MDETNSFNSLHNRGQKISLNENSLKTGKQLGSRATPSWAGERVEVVDPDPSCDSNPTPPSSREGFNLCPIPALEGGRFCPLPMQGKDGATPSYSSAPSLC